MSGKAGAGRRKFLATLGVGSVGAVAAALTQSDGKRQVAPDTSGRTQGKGYQLTRHVQRYYRTART